MLKKKLKRIGISALILLVIFLIGGFVYVYYTDSSTAPNKANLKPGAIKYQAIKPPPKPGPNARVGVAEESFDTPVAPGATTSIIIQTTAGATCRNEVTNQNGQIAFKLNPKVADAYGTVSWSWTIPANTRVGDYPVKVTCRLNQNWAVYNDTLVVTN